MAFGHTQRPVPPGMKQALASLWNVEHECVFPGEPGLVGFIEAKDDGSGV